MVAAKDIRHIDIFKGLDDRQLGKLAAACEERQLEAGAICFTQGEKADKLHICSSGAVDMKVWLRMPWGIEVTVYTAKDGETFGWFALVEPYIYFNTAQCVEKTREITIGSSELNSIFAADPRLGYQVFTNLLVAMKAILQADQYKLGSISAAPAGSQAAGTGAEWVRTIHQLANEGESTNVVLKKQLNLKDDAEKAVFVKDILGLANTRSSGKRLMVIGFDSHAHSFTQSANSGITQRLFEQIMDSYAAPAPKLTYNNIPLASGGVSIIEVTRDSRFVPYRVKEDLGGAKGIRAGEVYVRHGSVTEAPTERELANLA
jgi:CRP-like cAMP-binding protein